MEKGSDICLVVEGNYPYVTGGVSSWLQWLMEKMKEFTFSIVALIPEEKKHEERKYSFPDNVVLYREFVLFDYDEIEKHPPSKLSREKWQGISDSIYQLMKDWRKGVLSEGSLSLIRDLVNNETPGIFRNFLEDEAAFALLTKIYEKRRDGAGFLKYFYAHRNIHLILFRMLSLYQKLPSSKIYHSPGTGYAGMLACLKSALDGKKSIITEHGIYLQEREMELLKAGWLEDPYLKEMWIDFFSAICRWQYNSCDRLITLYQGNKYLEVEYGARAEKIMVVPNGIEVARFKEARCSRCTKDPRMVGLVGRVNNVKDIKTFLEVMAIVKKEYQKVEAWIIGPTDNQPEYYTECTELLDMLGLNDTITFTGIADVLDYYKKMDVLVLTSIKEAMPLVVMEAMACGIPVVTTDVGACNELVYGLDDGIGPAGIVARIRDVQAIAAATVKILEDRELASDFGENGIKRIERLYREDLIIKQYFNIYQEELNGGNLILAEETH
jgi:glycosyltransferase involved in cell wall biosynthesis